MTSTALFYGGLVNARNLLSVLMQCFVITCMVSLLWVAVGYSITFGDGGSMNAWWGGGWLADKGLFRAVHLPLRR
ncbi:MAG TPA: ammonium transporter [Chromatiaceae bacterium]|jgi:Amt family ammonium transporter|nr:ammonium transporter [Chromatiaceae bacterium]